MQVKVFSFALGIVLAAGTVATAQTSKTPSLTKNGTAVAKVQPSTEMRGRRPHSAADRVANLDRRVGLTAAQKSKLLPMFESTQQQMQALRNDKSLSPHQKREKFRALRQSFRAQVDQVLTPEQRAKLGSRGRRERLGSRQAWHSGGAAGPGR
ncbi:MAG: hypothetical protein ACE14M_03775 [Terriglobales bacterium]